MLEGKKDHTGYSVDNALKGAKDWDITTSLEAAVILVRDDSGLKWVVCLGKNRWI